MPEKNDAAKGSDGKADKVTISVIVNGRETVVEANAQAELMSVIARALEQTGNEGQPKENWELRGPSGVIDPHIKVGDLQLPPNAKLFLDPKVGVTGDA